MSQAIASPSVTPSFPPLAFRGVPVLTTEMLAQAYEVETKQIRQNFANNRDRFLEGKHFFQISGNDLREFKNCVENFDSVQFGKRTPSLTLWTERGAARNAKMLNSDRAWDVFELLEETFFRVVRAEATPTVAQDAAISPAERAELKALVDAKLSAAPAAVQGKARAEIWTRFNRHFKIAEYAQLPAGKMPDAREYLIQLSVKALQPAPQPVEPSPCPAPVSMSTGRADALRKIESAITAISGAQDVLRLFCHPGAVTMRMAAHERALYHAEHTLFTHAIDTLYFVQCALENGNTLERLRRTPDAGRGLSAARG